MSKFNTVTQFSTVEFKCLALKHLILGIFGSKFLKIYFLDLHVLFSKAHILTHHTPVPTRVGNS